MKGTSDRKVLYGGSNVVLRGYVDADMAGDINGKRSTTCYVFNVGDTSVSWISKLQNIVALSTTKIDYVATTEVSKEMIWMQ